MYTVLLCLRQYSTVRFCSGKRVDVGPTSSTSSGMTAELPTLPEKDDVLVDKDAAVPETCLSPVKMRTPVAADGLLIVGTASTAIQVIFPHGLFFGASVNRLRKVTTGQTT